MRVTFGTPQCPPGVLRPALNAHNFWNAAVSTRGAAPCPSGSQRDTPVRGLQFSAHPRSESLCALVHLARRVTPQREACNFLLIPVHPSEGLQFSAHPRSESLCALVHLAPRVTPLFRNFMRIRPSGSQCDTPVRGLQFSAHPRSESLCALVDLAPRVAQAEGRRRPPLRDLSAPIGL